MSVVKIKVIKKVNNLELAEEYCVAGVSACPCPAFTEGQEFITQNLDQPANFCTWAWDDIFKYVTLLHCRGDMSDHMNRQNTVIACCTDGIRPVVFRIEKIN